jgi:hypothetical protein
LIQSYPILLLPQIKIYWRLKQIIQYL